MKSNKNIDRLNLRLLSLFLQALLLWLTISLPGVAEAQQQLASATGVKNIHNNPETDKGSPVPGAPEETTASGITLSEEFLPHHFEMQYGMAIFANQHPQFISHLFVVFHIELFSPPPEC